MRPIRLVLHGCATDSETPCEAHLHFPNILPPLSNLFALRNLIDKSFLEGVVSRDFELKNTVILLLGNV